MLKAILFDLDETLIDRRATVAAAAHDQYCRRFQKTAAFSEADYVAKLLELDAGGKPPKRAVFEALRTHFGLSESWQELLADRDAAATRCATLRPGALACLTQLKEAGYKLGVVTNGRFPLQRDKAAAAGIAALFSTFVVSEAEAVEKPDPAIFASALTKLYLPADAAVFVGDDPENDIRGAQAAGMKAIFVPSAAHASCAFADGTAATLADVPAKVQDLTRPRRKKDPLEGVTLEAIMNELVAKLGWETLAREISINCFANDPSVKSSLKFLRRTPWARAKVEDLFLRSLRADK